MGSLVRQGESELVEIAKGLAFVAVTAGALYLLLAAGQREIVSTIHRLQRANQRLELLGRALEASRAGVAILGSRERGRPLEYANPAISTITGVSAPKLMESGGSLFDLFRAQRSWSALEGEVERDRWFDAEGELLRPDGSVIPVALNASMVPSLDETGSHLVAIVTDLSEQHRADRERAALVRAIDQAQEAIVITDAEGAIEYVNPAFERISGYGRETLIGANPRILKSGVQDPAYYQQLWKRISSGEPWRGIIVNRRRDGVLYEEDATISPVRGADGRIAAYVGVKRDLTAERALEAGLQAEIRDRAAVRDAALRIGQGETATATARSIVAAVRSLGGVEAALVYHVRRVGSDVVPLASEAPSAMRIEEGMSVPKALAAYLRERLREPPTGILRIEPDAFDPRLELQAVAGYAAAGSAIEFEADSVALIVALARPADPVTWISRMEKSLAELAAHASPMLGPQLALVDDLELVHSAISGILDRRAYGPVFQPIVDLASRQPVGYEALTRFDDGVRPDLRFAEAAAVGLGGELQLACARSAIHAARELPAESWLSFNASPQFILHRHHAGLVEEADRRLVLELTEHVAIDDYAAIRQAIADVDPPMQLAIDDAGAGYASLRHVLELRPAYIKLDAGLIHGLTGDAARQALVAGMVHFASETGAVLVAEGIETPSEASAVRALGVTLGQGYLFGRPMPAGDASTGLA